jgi:hypothetical protein
LSRKNEGFGYDRDLFKSNRFRRTAMKKKLFAIAAICLMFFIGCRENEVMKTYDQSENNGVMRTYYEMKDGTWKCDNIIYRYRLELSGRMPNAEKDSCFIVLTDDKNLSFETVSKSLYSSSMEDINTMKGSIIVEMN